MEKPNQETKKNSYPPYPEYPYSPPIKGLFHNQAPQDSSVPGRYSVYIPDNFEPCSPGVLILTPNGMSAQAFLEAEQGQNWLSVSAAYGIVIVVVEPYEANVWNLSNSVNLRDDDAFLKNVYDAIRSKDTSIPAAFDLDERALYLAGYTEGGNAAHKFTMLWPQLFAGMVSVDGGTISESVIRAYGDRLSYPFAQAASLDGRGAIKLYNKEIPTPVWMIGATNPSVNSDAVKKHWITAADASQGAANDYAQEVYENGAKRVWVTGGESACRLTPEVIYREFLVKVQRFMSEPGGILAWTVDHVNKDGKGFFFTETEFDGRIRRWLTYVPSSYDANKSYPLVVAMHGMSSAVTAFTGDSRWQDAAEKYDLLIVFVQAFPSNVLGRIPIPIWNQHVLTPSHPVDDVAFIKEVIARTKKNYSVDAERIYATGHSNGSGMSWRLGIEAAECFTAIAPVGITVGSYGDEEIPGMRTAAPNTIKTGIPATLNKAVPLDVPLPVWVFMGRYDVLGADQFAEGNPNDLCLKYWGVRNGFNPSVMTAEYDETGRYYTRTWTNGNDNIPLFRYASVADSPHAYVPYECDLIWREFFSKITMDSTGKRYFNGREIVRG
jgi:polyhydroxybutyrate depolymerase